MGENKSNSKISDWLKESAPSSQAKRDRMQRSPEDMQNEKKQRIEPENHGPNEDSQIMSILLSIKADIKNIKDQQSQASLEQKTITDAIANLPQWREEMEKQRKEQDKKLEEQKEEISLLKEEITDLRMKISKIEDQERRKNLVINGVEEERRENEIGLIAFLNEKMRDRITIKEDLLEATYRLGKKNGAKTRPILLKFKDFHGKTSILKERKRLRGTKYFIDEDYSDDVRATRKRLFHWAKMARAENKKTFIRRDVLYINNEPYKVGIENGGETLIPYETPKNL